MTKPTAPRRHLPSSPFKPKVVPPLERFAMGDRVSHDGHGLGRVVGVEEGIAVLVDFGSSVERVTTPYTAMTKL